MTSKKIAVLVLVLVGLVLALSIGIISAQDVSEGPVMKPAVKNASVSPPEGNYTDSFTYTVDVRFYEESLIELQLYDPTKKDWITYKTREYRDTLGWQTLRWDWRPSDRAWEGQNVSYRFRWNNTDLVYGKGPYIIPVIAWEFRNAIVRPSSGYYNDNFTYSVSVKLNKEEELSLEVFNISSYKWKVRGEKQYTNTSNWQELNWDNITDIASADSEGLASYRFFFIESGERHESGIYYGPTLKPILPEEIFKNATAEEIFKNATVSPSKGDFSTAFNYTVEVINTYSGIEINNVTLEVYNGSWRHKGSGTNKSSGGNKWEWKDITFGEGYEGVAKYRFMCNNKYESAIYDGPLLLNEAPTKVIISGGGGGGGGSYKPYIRYENAIVDPSWEVIGVREEKSFNYSVDVDRDVSLVLAIYNASSKEWEEKGGIGEESRHKDGWRHEWRVNLTLDKNWEGTSKYRFYPDKQERYASQVFYGPEIKTTEASLAGWKKEIGVAEKALKEPELTSATVTPTKDYWFKKFTYTAKIKHPDRANMTVVLFVYKPGSKEWKPVPWRGYRYNPIIHSSDYDESNSATVSWTVEKKEVFDEGDAGQRSAFYFWYWDGYNEYNESTKPFEGPDLIVNKEPEFVGVPKLNPVNGSIYTVYEYRFDVNDPENDAVYGFLTIKDPLNEDRFTKTEKGEKGFVRFLVGPEQELFTEDKLTKTNKETFTSQYQLVYWDEGMDVKGERKTTSWFDGPHVSKIRNEHKVEPVKPESGKYNDEFKYEVGFKSSEKNTFWLELTIYDPSNPDRTYTPPETKNVTVDAGTWGYDYWNFNPDVFGPDDFGKTARYTIAWKDKSGIEGIIDGSGPYIERAVPWLSFDLPVLIMAVPAGLVVLSSLLLVCDLRGKLRWRGKGKRGK